MKAVRIHGRGGPEQLVYEEAPQPEVGPGEVLVRVYATGVIPTELYWVPTYETSSGEKRFLPIPGHDVSGVVEEVGSGVTTLARGTEVYGLTSFERDGAEAEYTIALPSELAPKPDSLEHVQAAAVPLSALTAWQALFTHAGLTAGNSILIHGAAGGVGVFAVQLARWAGAHVIATGSATNREFLQELGANEIIDYKTKCFEDVVHNVDIVFDLVGGDTLKRSWQVIKSGGVLVTVVSPRPSFEEARAYDVRPTWFVVEPNHDQLIKIGELVDAGHIRTIVEQILPLSQARLAYEQRPSRGKTVLHIVE
jgi:NADPH:quinone reductase-like Zn-dependent oxidoreductase